MTILGLLHHFLGIGVIQTEKSIFIYQKKYPIKLLNKFGLKSYKSMATSPAVNEKKCKGDGSAGADDFPTMLEKFKSDMMQHYKMTVLGLLHHFLGIGVIQTEKSIFIYQKKYPIKLLNKFGLKGYKLMATPPAVNEKKCKVDGSAGADEYIQN
ncbi:unnamed protein product [Malus baccata var. baccata]